jgi:hypothetical protein
VTVDLPRRKGTQPSTTQTNPHTQLDQQPDDDGPRRALASIVFALEGVEERASIISVLGARALWLRDNLPGGPSEAFIIEREFAHLHPAPDHSLHVALPLEVVEAVFQTGWGEPHPVAARGLIPRTAVMIYAPRDADEVHTVAGLVETSWRFARGEL